tara:strand:- start:2439 stop:3506 length:1068 start_codon:yes stop_codon:yes gene_type:complete
MAVPSSGAISLLKIKNEVDEDNYNANESYSNISLAGLATGTINANSESKPNSSTPHAFSEWYGYDNDAASAFVDAKAVRKSLGQGTANAIYLVDSSDLLNFTESDAFSISFWVKAGWSNSLNTNIHFVIGLRNNANSQAENLIKVFYDESINRIRVRFGNKTNSGTAYTWYSEAQWLFHSNSGAYAAGYAAAGLGSTYWSASNRGYVGANDYTMITVTKTASNTNANSLKLYWNANAAGVAPIQTNNSSGNKSTNPMSSTEDRLWSVGSNGKYGSNDQKKVGNSTATRYNDLTIWDKELTASEVTSLYNSGSPMNATTHSASSNLEAYWQWEGNGNGTVGGLNWTIAGGSNTNTK